MSKARRLVRTEQFLAWAVVAVVASIVLGACTEKKEPVLIGDPSVLRPDDRELTPTTLMMNAAMYLDRPAKVRTEFVKMGGRFGDCRYVSTQLGAQELELCVFEPKWEEVVSRMRTGDPMVVIGRMTSAGSEDAPRMVFKIVD